MVFEEIEGTPTIIVSGISTTDESVNTGDQTI